MLISCEGIVLRQRKIAGNRRMITIFSKEYGKLTAGTSLNERGKGRSALALRPFTHSEYEMFKARNSCNINSAQVKQSFFSIGEDIDRYMAASKLIEYVDSILEEGEPSARLFDMTIECLRCISESDSSAKTLLYAYVVKSLRILGVMPAIGGCVNCGRRDVLLPVFSIAAGGCMCRECSKAASPVDGASGPARLIYEPSFDIVQVLDFFVKTPFRQFVKLNLKPEVSFELEKIVSEYVSYYLGSDVFRNMVNLGME